MKYIVILGSILMAPIAFITMGSIGSGGNIDFETATLQERQAWMDGQAKTLKTAAKYFLPNGGGPRSLNFYLKDVVTRPNSSEMEMKIDVKVPYGAKVGRIPKNKFLDSFCHSYIKTALYRQNIKLVANFQDKKKKKRISRITVSPQDCRWLEKKNS